MKLRILSLLLAVLMLTSACAFTACSDPVEPDGTTADTTSPVNTETDNPAADRLNTPDNLPDGLDFGDATLVLLTRTGDDDTKREFIAEKEDADVVSSAVFERNSLVEDRLNIKISETLAEFTEKLTKK